MIARLPGWRKVQRLLVLLLLLGIMGQGQAQEWEMTVCATPDNLPYSNEQGEGFENRIAEIIAQELEANLAYVWLPRPYARSREVLIRKGACDVVMGIPDGHSGFLTTLAYYRSSYIFLYREDSTFMIGSMDDPVLRGLRIGVQIGGEGASPGSYALANRGLIDNQVGFVPDYGSPEPLATLVEAVAKEQVDVAIVWGPVAGYFAERHPAEFELVPVTPQFEPPFVPMVASISIGVRPGDQALRDQLNVALARRWDDIQAVLQEYGVPLLPLPKPSLGVR